MKLPSPPRAKHPKGLTIIELTTIILVLLSLVSIMFIGAQTWKSRTDRSTCILKIRDIQVATRSYQNLYEYSEGGYPAASGGTQNIAAHLYAKGYIEADEYGYTQGSVKCPSSGTYTTKYPEIFPAIGDLYMTCSLSSTNKHAPQIHADW